MTSQLKFGGIVLCGGKSSRMGQPKAWLDFGGETALQRVVRILAEAVSPIVVVAAPQQALPELPAAVRVLYDETEYLGPLSGMAMGLAALREIADAAYVTACDVPLLTPLFIQSILNRLGNADCAVPFEDSFYHPLAGVYRTALADLAGILVVQRRLRPLFLIEAARSVTIPARELRSVDPDLLSLRNMNTPGDYETLKQMARELVRRPGATQ